MWIGCVANYSKLSLSQTPLGPICLPNGELNYIVHRNVSEIQLDQPAPDICFREMSALRELTVFIYSRQISESFTNLVHKTGKAYLFQKGI